MPSSQPPSTPPSTTSRNRPDGLFKDTKWWCNCEPRLPAVLYTVRKESENKGRTFYACQQQQGNRRNKSNTCDFFLWSEKARAREGNSLFSNGHSEVQETPSGRKGRSSMKQATLHETISARKEKRHYTERTSVTSLADLDKARRQETPMGNTSMRAMGATTGESSTARASHKNADGNTADTSRTISDDLFGSDLSSGEEVELVQIAEATKIRQKETMPPPKTPSLGSKRKRAFEQDEDEYGGDLSSDEEEQLAAITDSAGSSQSQGNSSSSSSIRGYGQNALPAADNTPSMPREATSVENGAPTPLTGKKVERVLFKDQPELENGRKRQRTEDGSTPVRQHGPATPSTSSTLQATTPGSGSRKGDPVSLTQEVMSLLKDQKINETIRQELRGILDRHAAKAKGFEKGRDAMREEVRKAGARVAQLQQKVAALEDARKMDAEARRNMRTGLMQLYQDH